VETVDISGTIPEDTESATRHYTRFFYVPPLGCFAWIANSMSQVALLTP
jgi:hypothetical protein